MKTLIWILALFPFASNSPSHLTARPADPAKISVMRCPQNGIQPQAVVDAEGGVHLIYMIGKPSNTNIMYSYQAPDATKFSEPKQVNSQAGSATAVGTIRGAHLAIGKNNRPHVVWNGNKSAEPRPKVGSPMLYTRMKDDGSGFEEQRNIITWAHGIDGGGSVAADRTGNVYVTWHSGYKAKSEAERKIYVARSANEGEGFKKEVRANSGETGACGCCGMKAGIDKDGNLFIMYRAATKGKDRSMMLITAKQGKGFKVKELHPWRIQACMMSSSSMAFREKDVVLAWETKGQVHLSTSNSGSKKRSKPTSPSGEGKRKHPIVVTNKKSEVLLIWAEGTGWNTGGTAHWQLFDKNLRKTKTKGGGKKVSVWSFATGFARPDGSFVVIH